MEFESKVLDNIMIIKPLMKRIDAAASAEFKEKILDITKDADGAVILNLAEVDFVDSRGMGTLIAIHKNVDSRSNFALCEINDHVMVLFNLTRMNKVFKIFATQEQALHEFMEPKFSK